MVGDREVKRVGGRGYVHDGLEVEGLEVREGLGVWMTAACEEKGRKSFSTARDEGRVDSLRM